MKFKDRFTEEQRKTHYYIALRSYYYVGGYGLLIIGILGMIVAISMLIYGKVWKYPEGYTTALAIFVLPLIPLIGALYVFKAAPKKVKNTDWEYVYKVESETEVKKGTNPWVNRKE